MEINILFWLFSAFANSSLLLLPYLRFKFRAWATQTKTPSFRLLLPLDNCLSCTDNFTCRYWIMPLRRLPIYSFASRNFNILVPRRCRWSKVHYKWMISGRCGCWIWIEIHFVILSRDIFAPYHVVVSSHMHVWAIMRQITSRINLSSTQRLKSKQQVNIHRTQIRTLLMWCERVKIPLEWKIK